MANSKSNPKQEWAELSEHLRTLRDEIRLKIHLAGMDLRDAWRQLDPEVDAALGQARRTTEASLAQARHLLERVRGVRERMNEQPPTHPPA